jgi:hypothetical protein
VKTRFFLQDMKNIFMADSIFYLNHKTIFMKKHFLALIAACSVLAACNGTPKSDENPDSKPQTQALVSSDADGAEAPPTGAASGAASSSFIPKDAAQAMIDAYTSNPSSSTTTKYYLADAAQIKAYLDYAETHEIKDVQIIFARNEDQLTIVITGVKPDGTHILYPDPNNSNIPSVIEHCLPCPPGTDCYTSTNLSQ